MKNQKGFLILELLLVLAVLGVVFLVFRQFTLKPTTKSSSTATHPGSTPNAVESKIPIWEFRDNLWRSTKTPPDCKDPLPFILPSDIKTATSTIWPGQIRGDYKAHGGIRYDNTQNGKVNLRAPMDGIIFQVARYKESGEHQIMIDVINNCGIMYRIDHINELAPNLTKIMDNFPGDGSNSHTYPVSPPVPVQQGDLLALSIGHANQSIFYDLGVYDLRKKNESAKNPAYAASRSPEFAHHAICWFDLLDSSVNQTLRKLPTGKEGKSSDYC